MNTSTIIAETIGEREVTVKDLVIAAGKMGCSVSTVAPPPWATRTEIDDTDLSRSVIHRHEAQSDRFGIDIEKFVTDIDHGTSATIWWDRDDTNGRTQVDLLDVNVVDIPGLITALQQVLSIVNGTHSDSARVLRRSSDIDDQLRGLEP